MNLGESRSFLHIVFGLFFFFLAHSGRLNCMIIHLGALIYPLPVALNVGLFCEAALRISNEPTAQSVSFSEGAYLRPYSQAGLWANERPYVVFSHRKLQRDFSLLTMCSDQIFFFF